MNSPAPDRAARLDLGRAVSARLADDDRRRRVQAIADRWAAGIVHEHGPNLPAVLAELMAVTGESPRTCADVVQAGMASGLIEQTGTDPGGYPLLAVATSGDATAREGDPAPPDVEA